MKKIIIATDFSRAALNAAEYAVDMALAINAHIILLHTFELNYNYNVIPIALYEEEIKHDLEKEMDQLKDSLIKKANNKIEIKTEVHTGKFEDELNTVCELFKPYVVIIGCQGKTASERFWFGSHAIQVMKNIKWPIIAVPMVAKFSSIKKTGLAWDLARVPLISQVEEIKKIVIDFNSELHIINTGKPTEYNPDTIEESMKFQKMLSPVIPVYNFISDKNTDKGIIRFAEKNKMDLLIVMPKQRSFFERLIHKSHTEQLLWQSDCPVMSLH